MKFVHMINTLGTDMWVTEDRVEEYRAAGHKLAADAVKPTEEKPEKKTTRKTKK